MKTNGPAIVQSRQSRMDRLQFVTNRVMGTDKGMGCRTLDQQIEGKPLVDLLDNFVRGRRTTVIVFQRRRLIEEKARPWGVVRVAAGANRAERDQDRAVVEGLRRRIRCPVPVRYLARPESSRERSTSASGFCKASRVTDMSYAGGRPHPPSASHNQEDR